MSHTIFFSWQSDRPTSVCRNFIERALQDAVKRISEDTTIEKAPRGELSVDRDTQNVPGSPPIFDTILTKINNAVIFVPDLTFVEISDNSRHIPNPNVLIEYGYALDQHGYERIIAVMNTVYGEPTEDKMPFNLRHRRFPIQYALPEDATDEIRKNVRISLSKELEFAIRLVFESKDFETASKAKTAERPRTALDEAEEYAKEIEYENAINHLGYGEGLERVRANVRNLFTKVEEYCAQFRERSKVLLEFEAKNWDERAVENFCVVRGGGFSMSFGWFQKYSGTDGDAFLYNIQNQGEVLFQSEVGFRVHHQEPKRLETKKFFPYLSRYSEVGWTKNKASMQATFMSNADLVDACFSDFLKLLRNRTR